ncbi:hypothetical protein Astex_2718 [Asticcacaulis excentricus CB 48]|uniref:Uncharacterized protein n=1 Tax=Asticcacaulis excentricus (strain ATCC 15261 / DSM 4724 / KCTC 12464 / NCIMB 9791 / VKM B-1370 / CB 48) TaxID=573065 RepID=E8RS86_ASTEC|nr:hypothetical protein Astex_2718 [Asticcacaulis excentricus CB 48]
MRLYNKPEPDGGLTEAHRLKISRDFHGYAVDHGQKVNVVTKAAGAL